MAGNSTNPTSQQPNVQSQSNMRLDKFVSSVTDQYIQGVEDALSKHEDWETDDQPLVINIQGWLHPELENGVPCVYFDTIQDHDQPAITIPIRIRKKASPIPVPGNKNQ